MWLRVAKYSNLFMVGVDTYNVMFAQLIHTVAAVGLGITSTFHMAEGYSWTDGHIDILNPTTDRSYAAFHFVCVAHAASNTLGLAVVALNYALAWRAEPAARETCYSELIAAAISCSLIWISVPFCFPFKMLFWLVSLYVEMKNTTLMLILKPNHRCFAGLGNIIPYNIVDLSTRMGELVMLFIGEGVLSIVVGLNSRRSEQDTTCKLVHTCCYIQEHHLQLPQECDALANGGGHLLRVITDAASTTKMDCSMLASNFLCSITKNPAHHLLSTDASGGAADMTYGNSMLDHMYVADFVCIVLGIHIIYFIHIMCEFPPSLAICCPRFHTLFSRPCAPSPF